MQFKQDLLAEISKKQKSIENEDKISMGNIEKSQEIVGLPESTIKELYEGISSLANSAITEDDLLYFLKLKTFENGLKGEWNEKGKKLQTMAISAFKNSQFFSPQDLVKLIEKVDSINNATLIATCLSCVLDSKGMDYLIEHLMESHPRSIGREPPLPVYQLTNLLIRNRIRLDTESASFFKQLISSVWEKLIPILTKDYKEQGVHYSNYYKLKDETTEALLDVAENYFITLKHALKMKKLPNVILNILRMVMKAHDTEFKDKIPNNELLQKRNKTLCFYFYCRMLLVAFEDYHTAFFKGNEGSVVLNTFCDVFNFDENKFKYFIENHCIQILSQVIIEILEEPDFNAPYKIVSEFKKSLFIKASNILKESLQNLYTDFLDFHAYESINPKTNKDNDDFAPLSSNYKYQLPKDEIEDKDEIPELEIESELTIASKLG